jgi:hypothetical protein
MHCKLNYSEMSVVTVVIDPVLVKYNLYLNTVCLIRHSLNFQEGCVPSEDATYS